jgi:hypothetical protein
MPALPVAPARLSLDTHAYDAFVDACVPVLAHTHDAWGLPGPLDPAHAIAEALGLAAAEGSRLATPSTVACLTRLARMPADGALAPPRVFAFVWALVRAWPDMHVQVAGQFEDLVTTHGWCEQGFRNRLLQTWLCALESLASISST